MCIAAANQIINRTNALNLWRREELKKPDINLTGKRVQKLLYLCKLFWLENHEDCEMIKNQFESWPNGPVIPEIYNKFRIWQEGDMRPRKDESGYILNEEECEVINKIVDNTADIGTETLIDIMLLPGSPCEYRSNDKSLDYSEISDESIKSYIRNPKNSKMWVDFILGKINYAEMASSCSEDLPEEML